MVLLVALLRRRRSVISSRLFRRISTAWPVVVLSKVGQIRGEAAEVIGVNAGGLQALVWWNLMGNRVTW